MALQIHLFGTPHCSYEGQPISIHRRKTIALLAYLAVTARPHSRDGLATLFWPEYDQSGARANLRRDLSYLKQTLGNDMLEVTRTDVRLIAEAAWRLDTADFTARLAEVQAHAHPPGRLCPACQTALAEAVDLYTGDFMAGFTLPDCPEFDEWQFFQREGLRQYLAGALQQLIDSTASRAAYDQAIEYGRRWLALDPLHEPAHRRLMQLYAWDGQQAAALRQYEACRRLLDEELGVEPEAETVELYEAIKTRQISPPQLTDIPLLITPDSRLRYRQEDLLAVGGHGELYRGVDQDTGAPVVIKRLRPQLIRQSPEYVARFQREGEALRRLNHPNIVKMLATFEEAGQYCIVMEYVPGGSLRALLDKQTALPADRVLAIGLELADALGRAHHLGILHRDLKPENVLLAADGTPRLTDFGVARLEGDNVRLTQTGAILGSPAYMSPEALRGEELDARSDVWSLGVLMYEMLAGQRPFKGDQITAILISILNDEAPELTQFQPDTPPPLSSLLMRMLLKDRTQRPASARLVAAELEAIRKGTWHDAPWEANKDGKKRPTPPPIHPATPAPVSKSDLSTRDMNAASVTSTPPSPHSPPPGLLIGREQELADLRRLLAKPDVRLLTVAGPGGMGKTRLALALAREVEAAFLDGACFVALSPLQSAEFLVPAVADALGFQFSGSDEPLEQLLAYLSQKTMLLVLDNFEHLLEGTAFVTELLAAAPGVKVLTTSRERLNLRGEVIYPLGGLPFPELKPDGATPTNTAILDYDSAKLLITYARRARAGFELHAADYGYVARICHLVGGMPLALMLAAGWLELLSLAEIADELARSPDFLESELRDLPERHRSMRTVFEGSWQRLEPDAQQTLARSSIFRGGFTREAARAVAGATLPILRRLVNQSLIAVTGPGRYEIHELLRQYAAEKLANTADMHAQTEAAHAHYYLALVEKYAGLLKNSERTTALTLFNEEFANIRLAWRWAIMRPDVQAIARFALPLCHVFARHAEEGLVLFQRAVTCLDETNPSHHVALGTVLIAQVEQMMRLGHDPAQAIALVERAMTLLQGSDATQAILTGLNLLGNAFWLHGDYQKARAALEEGLALLHAHGASSEIGDFLIRLGLIEREISSEPEVMAFYQKSLAELRTWGDPVNLAHQLLIYGEYLVVNGRSQEGQRFLEESLTLARAAGGTDFYPFIPLHLGFAAYKLGDYAKAEAYLQEVLTMAHAEGRTHPEALAHIFLGRVKVAQNALTAAERYLGEGLQLGLTHKLTLVLTLALVSFAEFYTAQHDYARAVSLLTVVLHHPATEKRDRQDAEQQMQALRNKMPAAEFEQTVARSEDLSLEEVIERMVISS